MKSALLLIDAQASLLEAAWSGAEVVHRINELTRRARAAGTPCIWIRDARVEPDGRLHPDLETREEDAHIEKVHCDAFFDTPLQERLAGEGIRRLVIAGLQTEFCIDTTCRRAISEGFDVVLAGDAHTTLDSPTLPAGQVIDHHNRVLGLLTAGENRIRVAAAREISFD